MLMHLIFRFDITKSSFILPCFCHFAHHLLVFFLSISLFVYSIPLLFFLSFCLRKIRIIHVQFISPIIPSISLFIQFVNSLLRQLILDRWIRLETVWPLIDLCRACRYHYRPQTKKSSMATDQPSFLNQTDLRIFRFSGSFLREERQILPKNCFEIDRIRFNDKSFPLEK